ncbi:hypothetical protein A2U01_0108351, partial [Trifolium medium]|nr:hypothetical protein [Trifolium medium]
SNTMLHTPQHASSSPATKSPFSSLETSL